MIVVTADLRELARFDRLAKISLAESVTFVPTTSFRWFTSSSTFIFCAMLCIKSRTLSAYVGAFLSRYWDSDAITGISHIRSSVISPAANAISPKIESHLGIFLASKKSMKGSNMYAMKKDTANTVMIP